MTAQLWCFGESGNAAKVAQMLTLTGTAWQPVFVNFFAGEARSPAFRAINPMGEVPVLRLDGRTLTQSAVMLRHLARKTGQFGWASEEEEDEILRWLFWDNHKFSAQIGTTRFLMNFLPPEKRPEQAIAFQQGRLKAAYAVLEDHLASRDWVANGRPSIADLSLASYLYYPEPFGFVRADWPRIDAWMSRLSALPGWKHPYDLMPRAFPPATA
ncbi:glutathione S-transferase family protein [Pseudogemmobacter blasticus]|uniref:Glutathione S-transferase n=1 Tax=Fuscovulum blasticum DSM 2131 TaxID=1188250 RepID=A0A2T4JCV6_FUSBL|nr:glutathione S-transferase family protein [Fuscovulum blasticum]PTE15648.1 glutathione S-transferase [Fuscovulum blasticum DSM 2131]